MWRRSARLRPASRRALSDAYEEVGHGLRLTVLVAVLVALAALAISGFKWDRATAAVVFAAAISAPALLFAAFIRNAIKCVRHPDKHKSWRIGNVFQANAGNSPIAFFELKPTTAMFVGLNKCEITDPAGDVWLERDGTTEPELVSGLSVFYPEAFPGAPPLVSGTYKIRWLLGDEKGRWREVLRHEQVFSVD